MNSRTLITADKLQAYVDTLKARLSVWLTDYTHALADLTAAQAEQPAERADAQETAQANEQTDAPEAAQETAQEAAQANEQTDAPEAAREAEQADEREDVSEALEANRAYIDSLIDDVCSRIELKPATKPPVITPLFSGWTEEDVFTECNFSAEECPR